MTKSHRRVLIAPLLHAVAFSAATFLFTFFSLALAHAGTTLSPLWFPTAIMMVGCYRRPVNMWLPVLAGGTLGTLLASRLLFPLGATTLVYSAINVIEALAGALLLRRLLPGPSPLKNLQDWGRLAFASAVAPPLLGGALVVMLVPGAHPLQTLLIWILSEAIGALSIVPPGLLYRHHYLQRHRNPRLLLETLATLLVTLALSAMAMLWLPWPFTCIIVLLMWSAVRLPRMEAFAIFLLTIMMVSLMLTANPQLLSSPHTFGLDNVSWMPFLMILLPVNIMTMVMYAFRLERRHIIESETRFRNAMEYSAIGMALVGTGGQWLQVNKSLCRFLGYSREALLETTFQQLTWPEDLDQDLTQLDMLLRGEIETYTMEKRYRTRSGEIVWALMAVSLVRDAGGAPLYLIAQIEDINDLKRTEAVNRQLMDRVTLAHQALFAEKERLHITLDSIGDAVICTDVAMNIVFMNPVAEKMCGCAQEEALSRPLEAVLRITAGKEGPVIPAAARAKAGQTDLTQDVVLHSRHGGRYDIRYSVRPLSTQDGSSLGSVLVIQDITESRKMLRQLSYNASHDALTRLANRRSFELRLHDLLHDTGQTQGGHALVFIDLDHFKAVNDSAGHAAGDALLQALAALMQQHLRAQDFLARLGGDEFGLLLPACESGEAQRIAGAIVQAIREYRFEWREQQHRVGASAGITLIDERSAGLSEVMSQADSACYAAKHSGRGTVSLYAPQSSPRTSAPF